MSQTNPRKYYKTMIVFEVLSEIPVDNWTLSELIEETTDGAFSGKQVSRTTTELNAAGAALALRRHGSDPDFFGLGEDDDETQLEEVAPSIVSATNSVHAQGSEEMLSIDLPPSPPTRHSEYERLRREIQNSDTDANHDENMRKLTALDMRFLNNEQIGEAPPMQVVVVRIYDPAGALRRTCQCRRGAQFEALLATFLLDGETYTVEYRETFAPNFYRPFHELGQTFTERINRKDLTCTVVAALGTEILYEYQQAAGTTALREADWMRKKYMRGISYTQAVEGGWGPVLREGGFRWIARPQFGQQQFNEALAKLKGDTALADAPMPDPSPAMPVPKREVPT